MKLTKNQKRIADQPLKARVEGQRLVISIGVKTLAFSAEHQDGNPKLKVIDAIQLAKDVAHELCDEDEIGATLLTDMLDESTMEAFNNGSTAFDHEQPIPER